MADTLGFAAGEGIVGDCYGLKRLVGIRAAYVEPFGVGGRLVDSVSAVELLADRTGSAAYRNLT